MVILYITLNGTDTSYQLPDFFKFGADILFKYRGFSLIGEFVQTKAFIPDGITHRNDRYNNPNNLTTNFRTYSPADYVRTQMMLGSGLNLQAGYIFKSLFSIDGRFTSLRPDELSFLNNSLFYNRNKYYEIGVSKYFTKNYTFKVQASYRIIDDARLRHPNFDRDEFDASEDVFYLMVQLAF